MLSDCLASLLTFRLKAPKYHSPLLADQSFIQNYNWPRYININNICIALCSYSYVCSFVVYLSLPVIRDGPELKISPCQNLLK